jgi:hypothetical protein
VARRCVIKKPRENEEAKARYRAVKIQTQWFVTPGKQTTNRKEYKVLPAKALTILKLVLHCINTFTLCCAKEKVILEVKHHAMIT